MSFWKTLGQIAGVVAAPFTGGTSLIPTLASIGGDIGSSLIQAHAANNASKIQAAAGQKANALLAPTVDDLNNVYAGLDNAQGHYENINADIRNRFNPYVELGNGASTQLSQLMDPNSEAYQSYFGGAPTFTAPDPSKVLDNPAIQFQMDQANKAIMRASSATGSLASGKTLKSINRDIQGVASQGYSDVYNRASDEFKTALGQYNTTRSQRLGLLNQNLQSGLNASADVSNLDTSIAGQIANIAAQRGNVANSKVNVLGQMGNNLQGVANVQAANSIANGNNYSNLFSNTAGNLVDLYTLSRAAKKQDINDTVDV